MLKITDIDTPPVPGKRYLVPCIKRESAWEPVLLPGHSDPEINEAIAYHYHYDWRFKRTAFTGIRGGFHGIVHSTEYSTEPIEIEWKIKECLNDLTHIPFPQRQEVSDKLEPLYKDKKVKNFICPHRGISLKSCKPDEDGNVICPGHGLKWNLQTGALIKR